MTGSTRRDILRAAGSGAFATMVPGLIDRALAIPAHHASGSIADVEYIVVYMQENRSFDHYFGMLNGVRGFGDPHPLRLAGGHSVWAQPSMEHRTGYVLPFHGDSTVSRSFLVGGSGQSHQDNIGIFHRGRYDRWGLTGELHKRMLYYTAGDLPFYYALADAFTVCDAYHCSTMTQTYPNRLHLFTGCNGGGAVGGDPVMSNYGEDQTPSADMAEDKPLTPGFYHWTTYAERLEQAGISWKVYQEYDNFGDNLLSVFPAFRPCPQDSTFYRCGRAWVSEDKTGPDRTRSDGEQLVAAFRRDVGTGALPQISWIVTATDLSEHPKAPPAKGEHIAAALIEALVDHPDMSAKTAFIINYDEAGGFYDHMAPPVPPVGDYRGHSTVPIDGETKVYDLHSPEKEDVPYPGRHPIGLGIRTPTVIVSPWSRGGFVCSELFDHTSVIRFMERRFGVREPNISAWRRAVCGDLTSAFDFAHPALDGAALRLPATSDFRERVARSAAGTLNAIPDAQAPTEQMAGQRPHRSLPYQLELVGECVGPGRFRIAFVNRGTTGATFSVDDNRDLQEPWHFTIGAGDSHSHVRWHDGEAAPERYDLTVRGPNGLIRRYAGRYAEAGVEAVPTALPHAQAIELALLNRGAVPQVLIVRMAEPYAVDGARERRIALQPGATRRERWPLAASDNWYDLEVRIENAPDFVRRIAGKVDDGRAGRTDPAIGTMRIEV